MSEFVPFPKIPRLNRPVVVTEKIDGTNACIVVTDGGHVLAQSRKRFIAPGDDNFGFAAWVAEHAEELAERLGPGHHFGEWWGRGIQRGYDMEDRRFSLFNTHRWGNEDLGLDLVEAGVDVVPVLGHLESLADRQGLTRILERLRVRGSEAQPGFMRPEGVVLFHVQSQHIYKVLLENDDVPKGAVA